MTIQEFNETGFYCGMEIKFNGAIYRVSTVDFDNDTIGVYIKEMGEVVERSYKEFELIK